MTSQNRPKNTKALVTLAIGDDYVRGFHETTRPNWTKYAERHGYDMVLITEPLDRNCDFSKKSVHWQKLLIGLHPGLRDYEYLVWIDTDILINWRVAPCIVSALREDKIGVVDISEPFHVSDAVFNLHARYLMLNYFMGARHGWKHDKVVITDGDLETYYRSKGFEKPVNRFINTGVIVFSPRRHAAFLASVYAKYDRDLPTGDYENTPLSYELQAAERAEYLDRRFNLIWAQEAARNYPFLFEPTIFNTNPDMVRLCANTAFHNSWFLHFAGGRSNPIVKTPFAMIEDESESIAALAFPDLWARRDEIMAFVALADLSEKLGELRAKGDDCVVML